ncbi:uncharacterized protein LOC110840421 isoform X2 [Zootermopsis nevadensis]|uniref:Uncharacterized protein n=2 Tax=Zootermopsis nevadensis TaxID=136037 RepID=A0A067QG22_ZOONE|nr:uncharacterized protein LOC110840421 isoform X2 [Zootermopsis nevadensis]KDR06887.1 hypothetical protein L798_03368 [Zootermopsis nevadensis]
MPPRRTITPPLLQELCLMEVMNYLEREILFCSQVRRYEHNSLLLRRRGINADSLIAELRGYLDVLPPLLNEIVRQGLINKLLKNSRSIANKPGILVGMLDILLNQVVKTLEFGEFELQIDPEFWPLLLKKCTGLERFVLLSEKFEVGGVLKFQPCLSTLSSNCPLLTKLVLKNTVQGFLTMAAIGQNCHQLQTLDITGSQVTYSDLVHLCVRSPPNNASDARVDSMYKEDLNPLCQTLEVLLLGETQVRAKGAAFVLRVIPNLTSLGNFTFAAGGMRWLCILECRPWLSFKLKHAFYRGYSKARLNVLANCCPALESLYFGSCAQRRLNFDNLSAFRMLRSLTLENIHSEDILAGLKHTPNLIQLQISSTGVDLGVVGQCCRLLEKLIVSEVPSETVTLPTNRTLIYTELQELKVTCTISLECAAMFMTNGTKLRSIEITRIQNLKDDDLAYWLRRYSLHFLEVLILKNVELTKKSVDMLLACCPRLIRLGELGSWDIRSWEFRRLKDLVVQENYDLHLLF